MEIIALEGNSNIGKSETINIVYQMMLWNGYTQVSGHFKELGNPTIRDFIDVLEKGGQKIGIVSQGDYQRGPDSLKKHLLALQLAGCVKAVCACTNKLRTIATVRSYPIHHFVSKTPTLILAIQRIDNGHYASTLYKLI